MKNFLISICFISQAAFAAPGYQCYERTNSEVATELKVPQRICINDVRSFHDSKREFWITLDSDAFGHQILEYKPEIFVNQKNEVAFKANLNILSKQEGEGSCEAAQTANVTLSLLLDADLVVQQITELKLQTYITVDTCHSQGQKEEIFYTKTH